MGLPCLVAVVAGVVSHQTYFRRGEHHLYPLRHLQWYTLAIIISTLAVSLGSGVSFYQSAKVVGGWTVTYFAGLYSSLVLYRALFHPLREIPGPYGARISSLWLSIKLHGRPAFRQLQYLHERYGPVVRIGPSNVSISHPEAVNLIYGHHSLCTKSSFYDAGHPMKSLHAYRNREEHDQRRRVWSTGFGDRRLRGYETRVRVHREKLFQRLGSAAGMTINISDWFNFYSYDVMGDLAFGRSFDMLDSTGNHWAIELLLDGIIAFQYYLPSWLFRSLVTLPGLSGDWFKFIQFATKKLTDRMNDKVEIPDICASFLAPLDGRNPTTDEFNQLMGDAMLVITAGSDTTATSLTTLLYELVRHPEEVQKLRTELLQIEPDLSGEYPHDRIAQLPHLNGFINETMRMHPPIPSIIPRNTPPAGLTVNGTYIPGSVTVSCPQWVIGRSEAAYAEPLSFRPERWYSAPELIRNKSAFSPFSAGPYSCIGKPLALMNIRTTVARLIMTFDIGFPAGEDGARLMDHAKDHFSLGIERMPIVLTRRPQSDLAV
ncbi:Tryprostatin B 6-hydroxylase [Aspergillus varians]